MYLRNSDFNSAVSDGYTNSGHTGQDSRAAASYGEPSSSFENEILASIPPDIVEGMRPFLRRIKVSKEQFLFQQDDEVDCIYFPETAILSEFHLLEDGRMVEVALTGRDGAIGISSVFCCDQVPNCVQVIQSGTVLQIEASRMKKIVAKYPDLPGILFGTLENYIRQLSQKVVCNMYHSLESRFCTWLLRFNDRSRRKVLKLTHEQLAKVLGVYRPSVTCIALAMKERSAIDYSRGGLSITDRPQLERYACGCYDESNGNAYHLSPSPRSLRALPV